MVAGRFFFFSQVTVIVSWLALVAGCAKIESPNSTAIAISPPPTTCVPIDPFREAINFAESAANLSQKAKSREDWNKVAFNWLQAITKMQAVSVSSPKRFFAQKKAVEYLGFLELAQQKAAINRSQLSYPVFNSQLLDEQLLLYLSYIAAVGPPDVLIVGSSRALQGVDPQQLQQALAVRGQENLKVFNFGINGATAQIVDLLVRQILTPEQLPRTIIWADGVRAFNSGRVDRTYNAIVSSPGYQRLLAGTRPTLPASKPEAADSCQSTPNKPLSSLSQPGLNYSTNTARQSVMPVQLVSTELGDKSSIFPQRDLREPPLINTFLLAAAINNNKSLPIDANGFLPFEIRFDPATYYDKYAKVSGQYDSDYASFQLGGKQATALNTLVEFTQKRQISLIIVNLPLTQDYLDRVRRNYEQQFVESIQRFSREKGFIFLDLSQQWLNQNGYFADPSHLNRYGAAAISSQLASDARIPWNVLKP